MHTITVTFEDKEFEAMKKVKKREDKSWHDFILEGVSKIAIMHIENDKYYKKGD